MRALLQTDEVLRARLRPLDANNQFQWILPIALQIVVYGALYGCAMGSFGGARPLQILYSAVKVPILLMVTFAISLPSYFVISSLMGLRSDFAASTRAIVTTQAGLSAVLCSLAPFTLVWYVSIENYQSAITFNLAMFASSSLAAQHLLRSNYRPLIEANPRHRLMMWVWLTIYGFVGIQMAWVLRPFIGHPGTRTTFFRDEAWGNAYTELVRMFSGLLGG